MKSLSVICLLFSLISTPFAQKIPRRMVRIPGETFQMGTDPAKVSEIAAAFNISKHPDLIQAETPQHSVTIRAFYLDRFEVTNADFQRFIRARPEWSAARIPRRFHNGNYLKDWSGHNFPQGKANHPVANVSWYAAVAFCQWSGKRLPTEAEWEFAARGGLKDKSFPWGDEPVDASRANYGGSKLNATTPVGKFAANGYGLFDLAGNVWEFTADEWAPYPSTVSSFESRVSSFLDVTTRRVIRGGSYGGAPLNLRVTYRDSHPPDGAQAFVGFRCAK